MAFSSAGFFIKSKTLYYSWIIIPYYETPSAHLHPALIFLSANLHLQFVRPLRAR